MLIPIVFMVGLGGFVFGYPILQLWTLVGCRGWWRAFGVFCLVPAVPFYAWSLNAVFAPSSPASLAEIIIAPVGGIFMLYLALVAVGFELQTRRSSHPK
jgi:hypothetical protein